NLLTTNGGKFLIRSQMLVEMLPGVLLRRRMEMRPQEEVAEAGRVRSHRMGTGEHRRPHCPVCRHWTAKNPAAFLCIRLEVNGIRGGQTMSRVHRWNSCRLQVRTRFGL